MQFKKIENVFIQTFIFQVMVFNFHIGLMVLKPSSFKGICSVTGKAGGKCNKNINNNNNSFSKQQPQGFY